MTKPTKFILNSCIVFAFTSMAHAVQTEGFEKVKTK